MIRRGAKSGWVGGGQVEFAAAGVFGATVDITAIPAPEYWNVTKLDFQTTMHFHNQTETITIAPHGNAGQQWYEDQNLSLTFFILFFASVDIAVTLYDHCYEVVTSNNNDTAQQKPKKEEGGVTEKAARAIIKWAKGGEHQNQASRRHGESEQDQRKKG
jgi:hypothetical protein